MRVITGRKTVVELGDGALPDQATESAETAATFGNRHAEEHLAALANLCSLSNVAQTIKVHVGAANDCNKRRIGTPVLLHVFFQARDAERA